MAADNIMGGTSAPRPQGGFQKWLPWLTKGGLAIADQGVFAASNFLLNILLARWLAPEEYGAFALVFSTYLSLLLMHNALFTTPMLVFGQGKYREQFATYLGVLLRCHLAVMLPSTALLVALALLLEKFYSVVVGKTFLALAAAAPFILLLWLLRRAFYARLEPVWAAVSGLAYFAILIAATVGLHSAARLTPSTAMLGMGAASLMTAILLLLRLQPVFKAHVATKFRSVAADHWSYGKWVAAGAIPNWVTDNIYFLALPAWLGLAQAGTLKALLNLAQPASQSISALGVLLMPILVRDLKSRGAGGMAKTIRISNTLFLVGSVIYIALLWAFRTRIMDSLYGNKFSAYGMWPLLAVGLIPLAQGLPNVAGAALGAIEKPKLGFWADVWSAGFALVVGIPLAFWLGVTGAILGTAATYVVMGFLTYGYYKGAIRGGRVVAETSPAAVPGPPGWGEQS